MYFHVHDLGSGEVSRPLPESTEGGLWPPRRIGLAVRDGSLEGISFSDEEKTDSLQASISSQGWRSQKRCWQWIWTQALEADLAVVLAAALTPLSCIYIYIYLYMYGRPWQDDTPHP